MVEMKGVNNRWRNYRCLIYNILILSKQVIYVLYIPYGFYLLYLYCMSHYLFEFKRSCEVVLCESLYKGGWREFRHLFMSLICDKCANQIVKVKVCLIKGSQKFSTNVFHNRMMKIKFMLFVKIYRFYLSIKCN